MKRICKKSLSGFMAFMMIVSLFVGLPQVALAAAAYTWTDITGTESFAEPYGIAVDSSGNMYVTDYNGNKIKELSGGSWTNITGSAILSGPGGVAVDANTGDVYVANVGDNEIWKLSSGAWTNTTGGFSTFDSPYGIAVDGSGNVYATDAGNKKVWKSTDGGTTWTDATGTGSFTDPRGIAADDSGNVYVTDAGNNKIWILSNGTWTDITGTESFGSPLGVAVDSSGNVFVADSENLKIKMLPNGGAWTDITGTTSFQFPAGISVDSSGNVYVTDGSPARKVYKGALPATTADTAGNNVIANPSSVASGKPVTLTATGDRQSESGSVVGDERYIPISWSSDDAQSGSFTLSGGSYTATYVPLQFGNYTITATFQKQTWDGTQWNDVSGTTDTKTTSLTVTFKITYKISTEIGLSSDLKYPQGIAFDSDGNMYVADMSNQNIIKEDVSTNAVSTVVSKSTVIDYYGSGSEEANNYYPTGVAVDSQGNIYIVDYYNNIILKADAASGNISTFLDSSAGLNGPDDVAVDGSGNLYITNSYSGTVIKTDSSGNVTVTTEGLVGPYGIAIDADGNAYVADMDGSKVCKISYDTNGGHLSDVAGSGSYGYSGDGGAATSAELKSPADVAVDSRGNLYIMDADSPVIRVVDAVEGNIHAIAGTGAFGYSGDGGYALSADISPTAYCGIAVDSDGNVYFSNNDCMDGGNLVNAYVVRKLAPQQHYVTYNSSGATGGSVPTDYAAYEPLEEVTVLGNTGSLALSGYAFAGWNTAADGSGTRYSAGASISMASANITLYAQWRPAFKYSYIISTYAGDGTSGYTGDGGAATSAQLQSPNKVALDSSGNLYIADANAHVVRKVDASTGKISTIAGTGTAGYNPAQDGGLATSADINIPYGLAVDGSGNVYISDSTACVIRKIDASTGIISTIAGTGSSGYSGDSGQATAATLKSPRGIAFDASGNLYIADTNNHVIRKIDVSTGIITTIAGTGTFGYSGDGGLATAAKLYQPMSVALDSSGNIYIADSANTVVRKIDASTQNISTVAGTYTSWDYAGDGDSATSAKMDYAEDIAVDGEGNLFITDSGNGVVRVIEADNGNIYTIAGIGQTYGYSGDGGPAIEAEMNYPAGLAIDGDGNIYVGDWSAHVVRKLVPQQHGVLYNSNGADSGSVPSDSTGYLSGATATVLGNTGSLAKSGYTFAGWNTAADGSGTSYAAGSNITMGSGNVTLYAQWTVASSGGGSSGGGSSTTNDSGVEVLVNGISQNAGTATTGTRDGQALTTIVANEKLLKSLMDSEGDNAVVTIPLATESDIVVGVVSGQMISDMADKQDTLELRTTNASYFLPASELNIDDVSAQLGSNVSLADIQLKVEIAQSTAATATVVSDSAQDGGFSIVIAPMDFTVTATYGGKTINIDKFDVYVERLVAIPDGVDPSKITTGVITEPDGTSRHVPTEVTVIDGKYYARINSLTNSTYTVVWHPIEFTDVADHWAKDAVNDMGSRMVVTGVGNGLYEPDRDITRAEFAAIIVRALGLKPGDGSNPFNDVDSDAWYCDYIETATAYKLIEGYGDGTFGPQDEITREQAMTMIARAMNITGLKADLTSDDVDALLTGFTDGSTASDYAKPSIAACVETGVVSGRDNNLVAPKDNITRAEVATIVERLLQKSDLI